MYNVSRCFVCELPAYKINYVMACISGTLFASGWWFLFDLQTIYDEFMKLHPIYHLPGVIATICFIFVNSIPLYGSFYYSGGVCGKKMALFCLFIGLVATFGALISAFYILIADFVLKDVEQWPGYAILMQNLFIFLASMLLRFGRRENTL